MDDLDKLGDFTPKGVHKTPLWKLKQRLSKIGIHKKAEWVKSIASTIVKKHKGRVPSTRKELAAMDGVGLKVINVMLQEVFSFNSGPAVDSHGKKICLGVGLVALEDRFYRGTGRELEDIHFPSVSPELVQACLETWLPLPKWKSFNKSIASLGQILTQKGREHYVAPARVRRMIRSKFGNEADRSLVLEMLDNILRVYSSQSAKLTIDG